MQKRGQTGKKIFINRESDYDATLRRVREELYGETVKEGFTAWQMCITNTTAEYKR